MLYNILNIIYILHAVIMIQNRWTWQEGDGEEWRDIERGDELEEERVHGKEEMEGEREKERRGRGQGAGREKEIEGETQGKRWAFGGRCRPASI